MEEKQKQQDARIIYDYAKKNQHIKEWELAIINKEVDPQIKKMIGYFVTKYRHLESHKDDLFQEVKILAIKIEKNFHGISHWKTWLCGVVRNVVRNYDREHFANQIETIAIDDAEEINDEYGNPLTLLDAHSMFEVLASELTACITTNGSKKENFKLVLKKWAIEEIDQTEAAKLLGGKEANMFNNRINRIIECINAKLALHESFLGIKITKKDFREVAAIVSYKN